MKTNTTQPSAAGEEAHTLLIGVNPKYHRVLALVAAAESAEQWLCETPKGTDQHERGVALRGALADFKAGPSHAEAVRACNARAGLVEALEQARNTILAMRASVHPAFDSGNTTELALVRSVVPQIDAALAAAKQS